MDSPEGRGEGEGGETFWMDFFMGNGQIVQREGVKTIPRQNKC